ncbi:MAG: hypothetical protein ABR498_03165, partial [Candidatus Dormibacteria bacterium]
MSGGIDQRLQLLEWRRRVAELYAAVRAERDPQRAWQQWRDVRADLFLQHPQTPLAPDQRTAEHLPKYFDYDPALRVHAEVVDGPADGACVPSSTGPDTEV